VFSRSELSWLTPFCLSSTTTEKQQEETAKTVAAIEKTDDEVVEDDVEDNLPPVIPAPPAENRKMSSKPAAKAPPPSVPSSVVRYDDDEIAWVPVYQATRYPALKHDRYQLAIDLPGSFSGEAGSWKTGVDRDGTCFFLKLPIDEIYTDPFHIHSYLEHFHKRLFSDDSALKQNWKNDAKARKGKMAVFRFPLAFKCMSKCSKDFGHPGMEYCEFTRTTAAGTSYTVPVLIIELKSAYTIEDEEEQQYKLKKKTFTSPSRVKKINPSMAESSSTVGNETAKIAMLLEFMMQAGMTLDQVRTEFKRQSMDPDAMDIDLDEMFKKRARDDLDES
jgi:hypothetical protein